MSAPPSISNPSNPSPTHFTEPTTTYWQGITSPLSISSPTPGPPYQYSYPALLPDTRILHLPIRPLPENPQHAVASLLVNQASLTVVDALGVFLADAVRSFNADVVIGLPTLGLSLAPIVARELGFSRYIPLGYSRKFWYQDHLSAPISSITSPSLNSKKIYLDPQQLPLVKHKRCVIIDDAVSSGTTLKAAWDLLEEIGCEIVGCGVVMKQGGKWEERIGEERVRNVRWVLESPLLEMVEGGWGLRS